MFDTCRTTLLTLACGASVLFASGGSYAATEDENANRIRPYARNPRYWQYKGKPVLLLGGTDDDNLFQWTGTRLIEQLNLLKSVGGNYVRCTMSGRDEGNVWPFKQVNGKYNLDQWDNEYWRRFENFLKVTHERDIIVQVEIWATYDFYREFWQRHPFNPKNNINYTAEQTGLSEVVDHQPGHSENVFFQSVPAVRNQKTVLKYQRRFVDKMLSHSLKFGHVLYCMDNETAATSQWGKYWSEHVKAKAKQAGVDVQTTEMWYDHLDKDPPIPHATFDDPETYSFVDVSQNSHKRGQRHWDSLRLQLSRVADRVRPLTNVKIYGADTGPERWFRADVDGVERFWRNIFGGMASARFHRPPAGLGLGEKAQANICSLRMLTDNVDIFTCAARNDLLSDRKPNEAYCLANQGKEYAVYFPDGGEVKLDISSLKRPCIIRWLEISTSKWKTQQTVSTERSVTLCPPGSGPWVVLLVRHGAAAGVTAGDVTFTRTRLTTVAETNMGHVPMADINGDGVIDIVAGLQWFEGPFWKRHPLYPPDPKPTEIDIGFTVPYDLDGDGDLDLTTHRRPSDDRNKNELFWFENPGALSTGVWTKHHITWDTRWPEVIIFIDIDGDGRDEMICSDVCPDRGIRIYEIPQDPENASSWSWTTVDKSPLHGLGIGDLNEDGRLDIVSDFVWFEQDARGGWTRHSLPSPGSARRGHETMQIKIYDVDADGDVDLILPRAHHYGAYWFESSGGKKPSFKLHEILPGKLPSQLHGVAYADIDGDGDLDIFAGKSRYRHGDPGNDEPLDVFWIELVRSSGRVRWAKHQLATDLTMGIGPTIADVDADGDMDLVLRGHGIGGRYVIGTRQTDVTLFIQNVSVTATTELMAKSAAWRQANDSGTQSSGNENASSAQIIQAPYPSSPVVRAMELDWSTHKRFAQGSDNFQLTWADDDHLYGAWGDGGGFGGTNDDGRVSLGVARVEGPWNNYSGYNVWGGQHAEHPAQFKGKSWGMICIKGILYMWVVPDYSKDGKIWHYSEARLAKSTDHGARWAKANWAFFESEKLIIPTICNFGKNYAGARDNYVYHYFICPQDNIPPFGIHETLIVHKPGRIYLARVDQNKIFDRRDNYQFFVGLGKNGLPKWGGVSAKQPVFEDKRGTGWCMSVSYNPGLGRYILCTEHTESCKGNLGIFDAPEPWGPWTTVEYIDGWGKGHVELNNFFWSFPTKWLSNDGREFTLAFTGAGGGLNNDSFNTVRGRFILKDVPGRPAVRNP